MNSKLTTISRRGLLLVAATLLFAPFLGAPSYAGEVPFKASYTGALVPIPVDNNSDLLFATVLDGRVKGSFGASMVHIVSEWTMVGLCDDGYVKYTIDHAAVVLTFSNGDQLFGAGLGSAEDWMCLDFFPGGAETGNFYGQAAVHFTNGTGRFAGVTGSLLSPFAGINITGKDFEYGFGPISGTMKGTLTFP